MSVDIEEVLGRELREVADSLHVPPMPSLPEESHRRSGSWRLLVAAAVVLLIIGCAVAIEALSGGSREPSPAPPAPPTPSPSRVAVPKSPSTATYELDRKVYVGGEQAPGTWLWVTASAGGSWVGYRDDLTWWRGLGTQIEQVEDVNDRAPSLSPDGKYIGAVLGTTGEGDLVGLETRRGGEALGATPVDLGDPDLGNPVRVRAVLDDGRIIAQGASASLLWLPLRGGGTVDLNRTAPGQEIRYSTSAGLVVTDGLDGAPYLAEISDAGRLTTLRDLPSNNTVFSPGAAWFAWTPSAEQGGEVMLLPTLRAQSLDGGNEVEWTAPTGWDFRVGEWTWEDDRFLVAPVAKDDGPYGERLARCSIEVARCVLIDTP